MRYKKSVLVETDSSIANYLIRAVNIIGNNDSPIARLR